MVVRINLTRRPRDRFLVRGNEKVRDGLGILHVRGNIDDGKPRIRTSGCNAESDPAIAQYAERGDVQTYIRRRHRVQRRQSDWR
jgi:hypothetical protein